jgi:O-antigen/teichoic acid export membrane protein
VVAREFWLFSAPRGLAAAFQITVTWFDVLMLEKLSGSLGETGIYGSTSRLVTVGTFALQAVRLAIAPQISALLARDKRAEATTLYQTATWWLMAVSWPLFLTLAVFAPFVLRLFGPEFVAGQHALLILSLAMLVNLGTGNVTVVLLMGGKSSWNVVNTAVALTLNVGLNLYLIPRYGMNGAAISWAVSIVTDNALALLEVRHFMGMAPFGSGYGVVAALAVACFAGTGLVVRATLGMSLGSFVVYAVVAGGVYAVLLYRFRLALRLDVFLSALRSRRSG